MTIMESAIAMNIDSIECDRTLGKINLFAEATYRNYEINLNEVALKVLTESGTEEDYNFLATEAGKDYVERARKTIRKIIDTIVRFINNCKDKIVSLFTGEKTTTAMSKLEDACEKNKKFSSKKFEYDDVDKRVKALQQGIDGINKKISKVEAKGYATEDDIRSIEDIAKETTKKVALISTVSAITIGGAIALLKKFTNKSEVDSTFDPECDRFTMPSDDVAMDPTTTKFHTVAVSSVSALVKDKVVLLTSMPTKLLNKVRGLVKSERLEGGEKTETESMQIEDLEMFKYVTEEPEVEEVEPEVVEEKEPETPVAESAEISEGLDLNAYFTELCNDLFAEKEESVEVSSEESAPETESKVEATETHVEESAEEESVAETEVKEDTTVEEPVEESAEDSVKDEATQPEESETETTESTEEVANEVDEVKEESVEDADTISAAYLEQLEHEIFGESSNEVDMTEESEATAATATSDEESESSKTESLIDTMETLL